MKGACLTHKNSGVWFSVLFMSSWSHLHSFSSSALPPPFINPLPWRRASCFLCPLCGWLALMMSRSSWECVLNVGLRMKAVILDMTVDKRRWLQCCPKCSTHVGTRAETKAMSRWRKVKHCVIFFFLRLTTQFCYHFGGPASSLLSIQTSTTTHPRWHHHGKCIGRLTHALHVSEYISNTLISSWPLKHHVPHGAA